MSDSFNERGRERSNAFLSRFVYFHYDVFSSGKSRVRKHSTGERSDRLDRRFSRFDVNNAIQYYSSAISNQRAECILVFSTTPSDESYYSDSPMRRSESWSSLRDSTRCSDLLLEYEHHRHCDTLVSRGDQNITGSEHFDNMVKSSAMDAECFSSWLTDSLRRGN